MITAKDIAKTIGATTYVHPRMCGKCHKKMENNQKGYCIGSGNVLYHMSTPTMGLALDGESRYLLIYCENCFLEVAGDFYK